MLEVASLQAVHVFSRDPKNAVRFCKEHQHLSASCSLLPANSTSVLRECKLVTTATTSRTPVFESDMITLGTHLNGVGSFRADMAEIPEATVCQATVFVDQRKAALSEAGDIMLPLAANQLPHDFSPTELGEVLLGKAKGRTSPDQITFFKSVGNAAQDIVCAQEILRIAEEQGLGQLVSL